MRRCLPDYVKGLVGHLRDDDGRSVNPVDACDVMINESGKGLGYPSIFCNVLGILVFFEFCRGMEVFYPSSLDTPLIRWHIDLLLHVPTLLILLPRAGPYSAFLQYDHRKTAYSHSRSHLHSYSPPSLHPFSPSYSPNDILRHGP